MRSFSKISLFALTIWFSLQFSSCKPDEPPFVCPEVWAFSNPQGGSYTFADSKLSLDINDSTESGVAMMMLQDSLYGDFTVSLAYEAFDTGATGLGAFLQMMVGNAEGSVTPTAKAGIGNVTPAGAGLQIGAIVDSSGLNPGGSGLDWAPATSTSGVLTISRTGNQVTTRATAGGVTATQTRTFNSRGLSLVIQVGSNYQTITGHVGVRLTTFDVTGGGTEVKADDFGCDSFY